MFSPLVVLVCLGSLTTSLNNVGDVRISLVDPPAFGAQAWKQCECLECFDLTQVAKGRKIARRWTKIKKKPDFAPGPGTVIVGLSVKNCVKQSNINF